MEGKTVIVSVLLISLFMAQIQVEAQSSCLMCPNTNARNIYDRCRSSGGSQTSCLSLSGCRLVCRNGYPNNILENSGDAVNEYCNLGCTSSVCGAMTTLQKYDASEIVNGAVEQCTKACSTFCTKGSKTAIETV